MESTKYQTDRHYSVGTDNKPDLKEQIAKVHGVDCRQRQFVSDLEKMLGDEKEYRKASKKFKSYVRYHVNTPQNADELTDEFINSGYITALERLRAQNSAKDLDYFGDYAKAHNMTLPQAVLFGPNGTAREALRQWRRSESLRGQHHTRHKPQNKYMAEAYDKAFNNTSRLPRSEGKKGEAEDMDIDSDHSRLPDGIESQIVKAFGRERQLYMTDWYKGTKRLSGDLPYQIVEAMATELLAKPDSCSRLGTSGSELEKIIEDANENGEDSFAELYDLSGRDNTALKNAWNDARGILNNYADKLWQKRETYSHAIERKKAKNMPGTIYLNNGRYYWLPKKGEKALPLIPKKENNRIPGSLVKNNPGGYFWYMPHHNFRRRLVPEGEKTAVKDLKTAKRLQQQQWQSIQRYEPQLAEKIMKIRKWGTATKHKPTAVKIAKKLWGEMQENDPDAVARIYSDKRTELTRPDVDSVWPSWQEEKNRLSQLENDPKIPIVYQNQGIRDEWEYGLKVPGGLEKTVEKIKNVDWLKKDAMLVFDDNSPAASKQIAIQSNGRDWANRQHEQNKRYCIQGSTSIDKDSGRFRIDIYQPGFNDNSVLTEEIYHIVFGIMRHTNPAIYKSTQRWHDRELKNGTDPTCTIEEAFACQMVSEETGTQTSLPRNVVKYARKIFSDKNCVDDAVIKEVKANWPYH